MTRDSSDDVGIAGDGHIRKALSLTNRCVVGHCNNRDAAGT